MRIIPGKIPREEHRNCFFFDSSGAKPVCRHSKMKNKFTPVNVSSLPIIRCREFENQYLGKYSQMENQQRTNRRARMSLIVSLLALGLSISTAIWKESSNHAQKTASTQPVSYKNIIDNQINDLKRLYMNMQDKVNNIQIELDEVPFKKKTFQKK